jgi:hypothetical protein
MGVSANHIEAHNVVSGTQIIIYNGVEVKIPSSEAVAAHREALRRKLEEEAQARWGGMGAFIREEGVQLPGRPSGSARGSFGLHGPGRPAAGAWRAG